MADKALYVVGQKRFVATMRKTVPYAGPINYGWPARNIRPRTFVNDAVASTESQWAKEYETFVKKTMNQIKGA